MKDKQYYSALDFALPRTNEKIEARMVSIADDMWLENGCVSPTPDEVFERFCEYEENIEGRTYDTLWSELFDWIFSFAKKACEDCDARNREYEYDEEIYNPYGIISRENALAVL